MADKRVVVRVDHAQKYVDEDNIYGWGSTDDMIQIDCDGAVSIKVWETKTGNVIVEGDRERTELEDAEILEVKIYNDIDEDN